MKTVGSILKKARKEKGLSLEDVEQDLKIRKNYLEALEASDYSKLPSPVFIKGFIKNYARFLGLKESEVIAFWRREYDEKKNLRKKDLEPPQPLKKARFVLTPGLVIAFFVILGIVSFFVYIYIQYSSFALAPVLVLEKPADQQKLKKPFIEVVGKTDADAKVSINGQEIRVTESGAFAVNVDLSFGENIIEVVATNKIGRKTTEKRTVYVEEPEKKEEEEEEEKKEEKVYQGVEIEVIVGPEAAWLRVEEDGVKAYEGVLNPGAKRTFRGKEVVKIRTGKANATQIIFNGKDQGLMGPNPEPMEKEYKKESQVNNDTSKDSQSE